MDNISDSSTKNTPSDAPNTMDTSPISATPPREENNRSDNNSPGSKTPPAYEQQNRQQSTTVIVNTEKTSTGLFLLCFFFPFLAPLIALIKGQFGFLLVIFALWFVCFIMLFIPVIGWLIVFIIDIVIAMKIAKMKKKTEVVVNTSNM